MEEMEDISETGEAQDREDGMRGNVFTSNSFL
jgi:hypothetical protein